MDFTVSTYKKLLESLISAGYLFVPFKDYPISKENPNSKSIVILRHDVDRLPQNSLRTALIEKSLGIKGTYYFRIVSESYNEEIIREISKLGHEIGYHYEDVDLANQQFKIQNSNLEFSEEKLIDLSYEIFCKNLKKMKTIAEVSTICMHGSPLSKFDNKIIWKKYDYRNLGLIGEPYLDLDWNEFGYLTDTGRRWNGGNVSVRDKVNSKKLLGFQSTLDIIKNIDKLTERIMITVHPQRWNDNVLNWSKEFISQNIKNIIKKYFFVQRQGREQSA